MDLILIELTKNEIEAEGRLDYSVTEFESALCNDVISKAKALTNMYLQYKKAEYEYNKSLDSRNAYHLTLQRLHNQIKEG